MARKSDNTALNAIAGNQNSGFMDNALESGVVTFVATTTGKAEAHALATVTGVVAMQCFAVCGTALEDTGDANTAKIEVGTAASTAGLIAQTTATAIDANEIWHDATPDATIELNSVATVKIVSANVIYTVSANSIRAGTIKFYIRWAPISSDGNVVMAI